MMSLNPSDLEVVEYTDFGNYRPEKIKDVDHLYDSDKYTTDNFFFHDWNYHTNRMVKAPPDGTYLVDRVINSPLSLHSLSWRKWKDCKASNCPILDNMESTVAQDLRRDAVHALFSKIGYEIKMEPRSILYISRATGERRIKNEEALLAALKATFPSSTLSVINPFVMTYFEQISSFLRAEIVLGMHGGAMWNAARWLSKQQAMIEILPHLGPGRSDENALMMGAAFESLFCAECVPATKWVGDIDIVKLISLVKKLLARYDTNG